MQTGHPTFLCPRTSCFPRNPRHPTFHSAQSNPCSSADVLACSAAQASCSAQAILAFLLPQASCTFLCPNVPGFNLIGHPCACSERLPVTFERPDSSEWTSRRRRTPAFLLQATTFRHADVPERITMRRPRSSFETSPCAEQSSSSDQTSQLSLPRLLHA
ncbi:hypothetical protein RRG08_000375 [Elysia crispata]|uniref:Uncharacterized protein n=1 Tax=Elysia crispata TaxID=231223 RepID=A0AAE1DQ04_9GAST|nr:hypothetical protein RRG08_000375 [Elysia crispata]